jgi:hypothetical protein
MRHAASSGAAPRAPRVSPALRILMALLPLPLFAMLAIPAGAARAGAPTGGAYACYVDAVEGSGIRVGRAAGGTVQAVPLLPLYGGDRLMFPDLPGKAWVRAVCGSSSETFTRSTVIERQGQAPRLLDNVLAWISDFFADSESKVKKVRTVTKGPGNTLGAPRVLSLLGPTEALVVAGRRTLCLAWKGGEPPFSVKVFAGRGANREVVGARETVPDWEAAIDLARPLAAAASGSGSATGSYEVQIEDAGRRSAFAPFLSVEEATLPPWPEDLAGDGDDAARGTVRAAWLSSYRDGRYAFEALQRACDLAPRVQAAETLRRALAMGLRPPPY